MFFGGTVNNLNDLETILEPLGYVFINNSVQIGPVTFDFDSDWTDEFVEDISAVYRLDLKAILGAPDDVSTNVHTLNKIMANVKELAEEIVQFASMVMVIQRAKPNLNFATSSTYGKKTITPTQSQPTLTKSQPVQTKPKTCDCGAIKVGGLHYDWCSIKK